MSEESYVKRIERELSEAEKLWKRRRGLFVVIMAALIGYGSHVGFWGIPAKQEKIASLESEPLLVA